jgi:glucan phosphorylase
MSLIEESEPKRIRFALLACMSCRVNGVAELHSGLVKSVLFKDQVEFYGPDKFMNVTNGKGNEHLKAQTLTQCYRYYSSTICPSSQPRAFQPDHPVYWN